MKTSFKTISEWFIDVVTETFGMRINELAIVFPYVEVPSGVDVKDMFVDIDVSKEDIVLAPCLPYSESNGLDIEDGRHYAIKKLRESGFNVRTRHLSNRDVYYDVFIVSKTPKTLGELLKARLEKEERGKRNGGK